jgi:hypothetical protein
MPAQARHVNGGYRHRMRHGPGPKGHRD